MCPHDLGGGQPARRLADIGEGDLVDRLQRVYPSTGDGVLLGIGDDAAVVAAPSGSVVATTDTMVRGHDWRDDWSTGEDVGRKAVTQNVADVAAMGAVPTGLLVTLVADPQTPLAWVDALTEGIARAAAGYGVPVVGGDLSAAPPGVVTVSVTALGDLEGRPPVTRSGARPGDVVAVGGSLGWSGAGLLLYLRGDVDRPCGPPRQHSREEKAKHLVRRFHRSPACAPSSGPRAALAGATSMIDVSDGLSRDAGRVATASGVRIALDRSTLVAGFCSDADALVHAVGPEDALDQVLHGGEEHSLLATFPEGTPLTFDDGCAWTPVGRVEAPGAGEGPGVTLDGEPLRTRAWDHFAG